MTATGGLGCCRPTKWVPGDKNPPRKFGVLSLRTTMEQAQLVLNYGKKNMI